MEEQIFNALVNGNQRQITINGVEIYLPNIKETGKKREKVARREAKKLVALLNE